MEKVEFIESYIKYGNDYQWNDNHGELIRCKDCKYKNEYGYCTVYINYHRLTADMDYCSDAERKDND